MFCLDLNYIEETADGPDVTIAGFPMSGRLVYLQVYDIFVLCCPHVCFTYYVYCLQMDAKLHADNLMKVLEIVKQGSEQVHTILDSVVKRQNHH